MPVLEQGVVRFERLPTIEPARSRTPRAARAESPTVRIVLSKRSRVVGSSLYPSCSAATLRRLVTRQSPFAFNFARTMSQPVGVSNQRSPTSARCATVPCPFACFSSNRNTLSACGDFFRCPMASVAASWSGWPSSLASASSLSTGARVTEFAERLDGRGCGGCDLRGTRCRRGVLASPQRARRVPVPPRQ